MSFLMSTSFLPGLQLSLTTMRYVLGTNPSSRKDQSRRPLRTVLQRFNLMWASWTIRHKSLENSSSVRIDLGYDHPTKALS